jgi:hypothetical protein
MRFHVIEVSCFGNGNGQCMETFMGYLWDQGPIPMSAYEMQYLRMCESAKLPLAGPREPLHRTPDGVILLLGFGGYVAMSPGIF